jgi:hypothetical protein
MFKNKGIKIYYYLLGLFSGIILTCILGILFKH